MGKGITGASQGTYPLATPRIDQDCAAVVQQGAGKYRESSLNKRLFCGSTGSTGRAPGSAVGTTAPFTLYNPLQSGIRAVLCRAWAGYISGTLGSGSIVHCVSLNLAIGSEPSGTAQTITCLDVGSNARPTCQLLAAVTLASTPTILWPWFSTFAELATTASAMQVVSEDVDGAIVLESGNAWSPEGILGAAGTTPLLCWGVMWEEIPALT